MEPSDEKFSRQRYLSEIGDDGQRAIARATVEVGPGEGSDVAAEYLERAGFGRVAFSPTASSIPFAHAAHFRHAASRAVGVGAWRALLEIRRVVGVRR